MKEKLNMRRFGFEIFLVLYTIFIFCGRASGSDKYYKYLGCFADSTDLKAKGTISTLNDCAGQCQSNGYPYAGIQATTNCYCGMIYNVAGTTSTGCSSSSSCPTDVPRCGGKTANDVYYSVDMSASLSKSLVKSSSTGSFIAARMTCVTNNGDLPCPTDSTINADIITAASAGDASVTKVWIGLYRRPDSLPSANYYWTDETLADYTANKATYSGNWATGDNQTNPCISLDVKTGKWWSTDCNTVLPFVCKQTVSSPAGGSSGDSSGSSDGVATDKKRLALFIVLPLFIFCYGGSCILYCIHKIIKNCNRKTRPKMNLGQAEDGGGQKGAREKTGAAPPYRPLSAGKRVTVYPAPQPLPVYMPDSEIKQKLAGDPADKGLDPLATARGVKLSMDEPPKYVDRQEEKRARLLENASRESRMRREKEMEDGRAPSRPFTAPKRPPQESPDSPRDDPLAGSTTNLLGKDKDKDKDKDAGPESDGFNNTPISEILKAKMAQKADKKRPRKIITA